MGLFDDITPEEMASMDKDSLQFFLTNLVQQIGLIPTADLEAHVEECDRSVQRFDTLGAIFDPTAWMHSRNSGEFDITKGRNEMARHILAIRKLLDADEALRQEYIRKTEGK